MPRSLKISLACFSLGVTLSTVPLTHAQSGCDRTVDNTSIQAGITALSNGQTLCVKSGTYHEVITLNKENITVKNYPGHAPVLDGGYHRGLMSAGNGGRGSAPALGNHLPGNILQGMVTLESNEVTFEGFIVQNVAGRGVIMNAQNQTVQNNKFYWLYGPAIVSNKTNATEAERPKNLNMLNNVILFPTVANLNLQFNPPGGSDLTAQAIKIGNCRGPIRIVGNYAAFSYGEGFDIGKGCQGTAANPIIIENNIIHDTNHVKFYAVHPHYVHFRNNLAFDTNQTTIYSDGTPSDGFRSTNEVAGGGLGPGNNIFFYNNISFNNDTALALGDRDEPGSNMYVGFNTFVSGPQTRNLSNFTESGNGIIENNIFHYMRRKEMGGTNAQGQNITSGSPGNYTFRNNYWTHQPTKAWARSTTDKIGDPLLVDSDLNVTITGFPTLAFGANDQFKNFTDVHMKTSFTDYNYQLDLNALRSLGLTSQSQAINAGAFRQGFSGFTPPSLPFDKDFSNANRNNPDMGALEFGGVPGPTFTPGPTYTPAPSPTVGPSPTGGDVPEDWDLDNDGDVDVFDFNRFVKRVMSGTEDWSSLNAFVSAFRSG